MAIEYNQQTESLIHIEAGKTRLEAILNMPAEAAGVILFASGSGTSRNSRRSSYLADYFHHYGMATFLMDLMTEDEERQDIFARKLRFDIDVLAERLAYGVDWLKQHTQARDLPTGLFGTSTGAAAALALAAQRPIDVHALVCRGGRPDLASAFLEQVSAPTLLIVGGYDIPVIDLNRAALESLRCEKRLDIVPGATHLFEEPGALEDVAQLATNWFQKYLK
jgi:putative phosphoribosyl transferase